MELARLLVQQATGRGEAMMEGPVRGHQHQCVLRVVPTASTHICEVGPIPAESRRIEVNEAPGDFRPSLQRAGEARMRSDESIHLVVVVIEHAPETLLELAPRAVVVPGVAVRLEPV